MTTLHRPQSLRDFLDGGGDLTAMSEFTREQLAQTVITNRAKLDEPTRAERAADILDLLEMLLADPGRKGYMVNQDELTRTLWEAQVLVDDDLAERVISLLPAEVAVERMSLEADEKPYLVIRDDRAFKCGSCGGIFDGPCLAIDARLGVDVLDDGTVLGRWPDLTDCPPLTFCPDCVNPG